MKRIKERRQIMKNTNTLNWEALPTTAFYSKRNKIYDSVDNWIQENIYNSSMLAYCFAKHSPLTQSQQDFLRLKLKNNKKFQRWAKKVQVTL